jgi:hypothetical protein
LVIVWWWDYIVDVFPVRFPDFSLCMSFKFFKFGFMMKISSKWKIRNQT